MKGKFHIQLRAESLPSATRQMPSIPEEAHPSFYIKKSLNPLAAEKVLTKTVIQNMCALVAPKYSGSCTNGAGAKGEGRLALSFSTGLSERRRLRLMASWVPSQGVHQNIELYLEVALFPPYSVTPRGHCSPHLGQGNTAMHPCFQWHEYVEASLGCNWKSFQNPGEAQEKKRKTLNVASFERQLRPCALLYNLNPDLTASQLILE